MTSKRAVELARIEFQKDIDDGEETNQWLTNVIDGLKQAEKDLEILELLKELPFEIYQNGGGDNWHWFVDTKQSFAIDEERARNLKRWFKK